MSALNDYRNPNHSKYDPYLPVTEKLTHQQYDPYGIYSIAAITHRNEGRIAEFSGFVSWQKYDPTPITVDFRELVERYGNNDIAFDGLVVGGY